MTVTEIGVVSPVYVEDAGGFGSNSEAMYSELGDVDGVSGNFGLPRMEDRSNEFQLDGLDGKMLPAPEPAEELEGKLGVV